ncbi:MAG: cytochrome c [Verrucomicrobiota bacterium]|jgi:hypothetical protein
MRYFLLAWVLLCAAVVGLAGFRGHTFRKPPVYVFPDMDRQPKLRPQEPNSFFADGLSSRLPVAGTIERSQPYSGLADKANVVFPFDDSPVNSGRIAGTTNFIDNNPFQITAQFLARGQERFNIYCAPCHGPTGDGNGVTKKLGMAAVANLHDARIVTMADGDIFDVVTNGRKTMGAYGPQISVEDRWAVIAYLRALHLSQLATVDEVPEQFRSTLK